MEIAAQIVRNLSQRLANFADRMDRISGGDAPLFHSESVSDCDMEQGGPELDIGDEGHRGAATHSNDIFRGFYTREHYDDSSLNMSGVPTADTDNVFNHFYTGEHHDDSSLYMPASPGLELHSPPENLWHGDVPAPHTQAGGANDIFDHFYTGEHHHDPTLTDNLFTDAGPAPIMQVGPSFLDQLQDISLRDIPNLTSCNICMEPFHSTEDPESPVQLPCGHVMGRKCISRWLETSNSCPLCRHVLYEQERSFHFEQEGSLVFGQENFQRRWDNLEPRLQNLVRSLTAQEQQNLLQALQEPTPQQETETVQQGEEVGIPGVSLEEVEAYRAELHELTLQRAAIDARLNEIEAEDAVLTSQRATELRELEEDNEMLEARSDTFHARYRDLIRFDLFH